VGFARRRTTGDGRTRYTAYYLDLRGRESSAGTFATKREADRAWQRAEAKVAEGRAGTGARGRQTFRRYVEDEWLPHHVMEPSTREGYTYSLYAHAIGWFGDMRMIDILPSHVREWISDLKHRGLSPATIRLNKAILSAVFTTALNDQVTMLHPCKGVKTPTVPRKPLRIVTPDEFDAFYRHLPDDLARLVVELDIDSGLRWGELTELRVNDFDFTTNLVTVSRAVVELNPRYHPTGGRFLVKDYPKDRHYRRFRLSPQVIDRVKTWITDHGLEPDDLLLTFDHTTAATRHRPVSVGDLGLTEPNSAGRRYRHGSLSGYSAGRCRCEHCRGAYATYRATRRLAGKDEPRPTRLWQSDGHLPRRWFREQVLKPALTRSGIGVDVKMHGLRHAHASWLLAGGADLQVVKERLGHGSITTTEKYLHTLPDADDTAIAALGRTRRRHHG
jgi:integrase